MPLIWLTRAIWSPPAFEGKQWKRFLAGVMTIARGPPPQTGQGARNCGRFYARTIGTGPGDIWVNPMPMFHTAGCGLVTLGALQPSLSRD
jgi:acyl-CoA synthetase (AMP-forming)/AMP-acid ligase II